MPQLLSRLSCVIAINTSLSAAVALHGARVSEIEMPAAWDAAILTFQASNDNSTFFNVVDDTGNEYFIVAVAGQRIHINSDYISQMAYLKIRSGSSLTAVSQTAARTIYMEFWQ